MNVKYLDGEKEEAEFLAREGLCEISFEGGDSYIGLVNKNGFQGSGKYIYTAEEDGEPVQKGVYEGFYENSKKNGLGRMEYPDGSVYEGEWKDDERNGEGSMTYASKDTYHGSWVKGLRDGNGIYVYDETKTELIGNWRNGKMVEGKQMNFDGSHFIGEFVESIPGNGRMFFANGTYQDGLYRNGLWIPSGNLVDSDKKEPKRMVDSLVAPVLPVAIEAEEED
eukprot:TRINITY_DN780135_c0_g1_i1.p1 TRINITY_DN780135_c0_g1~~TRINITY_DN780135_c0_g1_i1.p1  ORF type:complete len:239 (+),score=65.75 TRINITY_DN780135_c0_g1_i1:50-718(+)